MELALRTLIVALGLAAVNAISRTDLYPYGTDPRETRLSVGDDLSSEEIRLRLPIAFYDAYYNSIFVNINGHLSFDTELPNYRGDLIMPLGYKLIVPFLADIDTRGTGTIYYRETTDRASLQRATADVQNYFDNHKRFRARILFLVTWEDVGYYNQQDDKKNTFQIMIASDGRNSFSFFLYPEDGINWYVSQGKYAPNTVDAPAQAGFDAGDGRRHYLLPNSGRAQVTNLASSSNVGVNGVWVYQLGPTKGENVGEPTVQVEEAKPATSCEDGGKRLCSINGFCTNLEEGGFVCKCTEGYFGNGRNCVKEGQHLRVKGKISGTLNGRSVDNLDLHAFVVTKDGRAYSAISRLEPDQGFSMTPLSSLGGVLGWVFGVPATPDAKNGYMITGGDLNRSATVTFEGNKVLHIKQQVVGKDASQYVTMTTQIDGEIPELPQGSVVRIYDYKEDYIREAPGVIKSSSLRRYMVGTDLKTYRWEQTITFKEYEKWTGPSAFRISVSRNVARYKPNEETVRHLSTNKIANIAAPTDPCDEKPCDSNAKCESEGQQYSCTCNDGYEGDGKTCRDINECELDNDCHQYADCYNTPASYTCRCQDGYRGDGQNCERELTCDDLNCDRNARCVYDSEKRTPMCECNTGFKGDGMTCDPEVFSCNEVNNCNENADCVFDEDTQKYRCECNDGFSGDGLTCQETGEPEVNCRRCDPNAACIYDAARLMYRCQCKESFSGDGYRCYAIADDCSVLNNCDSNADCTYDAASEAHRCICRYGFRGDGYNCEEEECNVMNNCDVNAECEYDNTEGRYACKCKEGYEGDGRTCREEVVTCDRLNNCHPNAVCVPMEGGLHRCVCRGGFLGDGYNCKLALDCNKDPGICDRNAVCRQQGENYVCVCEAGYRGDGQRCSPVESKEQFLMFAQGRTIMQLPYEPSDENPGKQVVLIPGQTAIGIAVDCFTRYFYWTDVAHRVISKAKLDGSDQEVIIKGLQSPEGVAVDFAAGNVYWTDSGSDSIQVARNDGQHKKTLFYNDLVNPRAIAIDPIRGVMFWADWNRDAPKIEMANMDGTDRRVLVKDNLQLPNGLTIIIEEQKLCWADAGTQHIECIGYDGQGRRVVYNLAEYPFDVAFANDKFYWTDWRMRSLPNINNYSSSPNQPLNLPPGGNGRLYGITAVKESCPPGGNACALSNGGCRYLCLPTPGGGRTCACPDNISKEECNPRIIV